MITLRSDWRGRPAERRSVCRCTRAPEAITVVRILREHGITASWKPHLPYRPTVAAEHAEAAVEALRRAGLDRREIEKLSPAPSPA